MHRTRFLLAACAVMAMFCLAAPPGWAAEDQEVPSKSERQVKLEEITVKGQAMHREDLPTTVNIIDEEKFESHHGIRTEELLNEVPGIYISNYDKGGVANVIRMRGFTSGGHGGDVGVFVDGIPLNEGESHADGYADMNVIIPLEIDHLEIYKGPSSALYGNFGRGGVLAYYTKRGGEYGKLATEYGSFGTYDFQGALGGKLNDKLSNNTAFQINHTDGYRDHSDWDRMTASTRFSYDVNDKLDVSLALRAHKSTWNGSNNIPQSQFDNDDTVTKVPPNHQDDGGNKKFMTQRFDAGYSISKELRLLYWAYATQQDFRRFQTRNMYPSYQMEYYYDRNVLGTGTSLNLDTNLASKRLSGVLGAEVYDEITDTDVWSTNNRQRQSHTQRRRFDIITYSMFGQTEYEVSRYFRPMVGLRYDTFGGQLDNNDPGKTSQSYDMNDFKQFSPKVGFRSMLLDNVDLRASYCEGFSLPSSSTKFDPAMQVDPVTLKQYEVGLNYKLKKLLRFDVAYFVLDSEGEVLENPIGSGTYTNMGKTRREGVETGVTVFPLTGLEVFATLTINDSEILTNSTKSLEGKEVVGNPHYMTNLGAQYTWANGLGCRLNWRKVGDYYIDAANKYSYDGYNLVNGSVFYTIPGEGSRKYKISLSVDNIFDERYADSVSYSEGTYTYAVAWPRTYWIGLTMDW